MITETLIPKWRPSLLRFRHLLMARIISFPRHPSSASSAVVACQLDTVATVACQLDLP